MNCNVYVHIYIYNLQIFIIVFIDKHKGLNGWINNSSPLTFVFVKKLKSLSSLNRVVYL